MITILANFKGTDRNYAFNLPNDTKIEVGNLIETPSYPGSTIIIREILEKEYKFGNKQGELFQEETTTGLFKIKNLTDFKIKK